jgi:hypothetical protein
MKMYGSARGQRPEARGKRQDHLSALFLLLASCFLLLASIFRGDKEGKSGLPLSLSWVNEWGRGALDG